jgi:formyl-CoA transferase
VIPRLLNHAGAVWRTGAALGEDNESVLGRWLGMQPEAVEELRLDGVIGPVPAAAERRESVDRAQ